MKLLVAIAIFSFALSAPAQDTRAKLEDQVDLKLKDLSGVEQSLAALKGRIVILNFWATYCIPCRKEMPDLSAIQNEFGAFGVQVIGVNTDDPESQNQVVQFVKETKINFPIWLGGSTDPMKRFGLGEALPGTVVIGRDGRVKKVKSGVVDKSLFKKQIESLLAVPVAP